MVANDCTRGNEFERKLHKKIYGLKGVIKETSPLSFYRLVPIKE